MIIAVADTHAVIWYIAGDARLAPNVREFLEKAEQNHHKIAVSAITLIEMVDLIESCRFQSLAATTAFGYRISRQYGESDSTEVTNGRTHARSQSPQGN